ncbi:MAG: DUF4918 family protein [Flavipsychrobacter sp.]|nr:DUF4918 family protein [Flavipsychrobacter sp.]
MTFAQRAKAFNRSLHLEQVLPHHIQAMNPFAEQGSKALLFSDIFYDKFYGDRRKRKLILGINPGRFGGGITGVPFTDFKRMRDKCGIDTLGETSHEPSSEFVYAMIEALGTVAAFYSQFYINSLCPLGFITEKPGGKWVNYNYYDDAALYQAVKPFMIDSIRRMIDLGAYTDECFCLGVKNALYFRDINKEYGFFDKITELPHPRFIVQYKRKEMDKYIQEYKDKLKGSSQI